MALFDSVEHVLKPQGVNFVPEIDGDTQLFQLLLVLIECFWLLRLLWSKSLSLIPPISWDISTVTCFQINVHHFKESCVLFSDLGGNQIFERMIVGDFNIFVHFLLLVVESIWKASFNIDSLVRRNQRKFFALSRNDTMQQIILVRFSNSHGTLTSHI